MTCSVARLFDDLRPQLMQRAPTTSMFARAGRIRLAAFDIDGVLTDGRLYYSTRGDAAKAFDVRDGLGLKLLEASGVELAIITSRRSDSVRLRAEDLGIRHVLQGVQDKLAAIRTLLSQATLDAEAAAFIGDDLVDLPAMKHCGFAATVSGAPAVLKRHADYVTRAGGGHGAIREICELIVHCRNALAVAPCLNNDSPRRSTV